jgi:hypothetical protein
MAVQSALAGSHPRSLARSWRLLRYRPSPAATFFLACLAVYVAVAWWVSANGLTYALDGGDAVSRVEAANRVLFSNDPHLAAIGFVWGPLLEILLLPLVALKPLWPALVTQSLAGDLLSAAFTAGATWQFFRLLREVGLGFRMTVVFTVALALDPLVLLHAADGMSEGWFLFFLISVARELNRWLRTGSPGALVACGMYLAVSYLARYETAAAAAAAVAVVAIATVARSPAPWRQRVRDAALRACVVATPFALAFAGWAGVSWLITGTPLQQFGGVYGNSQSLAARGIVTPSTWSGLLANAGQQLHSILGLEPFLPLIVLMFAVLVVRRRDWAALGAPAVLAAVFIFMTYAIVTREIIPLLRYLIVEIPLALLLLATVLAPAPQSVGTLDSRERQRPRDAGAGERARRAGAPAASSGLVRGSVVGATCVALVLTIVAGLQTLQNPTADPEVAPVVQALLTRTALPPSAYPLTVDAQICSYLDARHLPAGSVLMDDFIGYPIQMLSTDPGQFVITSDRDFQQALVDPSAFHIEYVLIPPPIGLGKLDAVNRAYPDAYSTGKGIGELVTTFSDTSGYNTDWRLYRVTASQ